MPVVIQPSFLTNFKMYYEYRIYFFYLNFIQSSLMVVHAGTIPLYQIYQIKVFRDHLLKQNLSRLAGYFKGYTPGERGKGLG